MRTRNSHFTALAALVLLVATGVAHAEDAREQARLLTASQVLTELRAVSDQSIPDRLLDRAYAIAVIPDATKVAWFFGGRRGQGALVVRDKDGRFSDPVFVTLTGGSFGLQWGVQQTDVVLVFTTPRGIEGIAGGKVTLGADASIAAGPVGRQATAGTDGAFRGEVYSYSRNRGAFVGIALDGAVMSINDRSNAAFYAKPGVLASDIMSGSVHSDDPSVQRFRNAVATSTGDQRIASAAAAPAGGTSAGTAPASAPPAGAATRPAPAQPAGGAQSFPLSDAHPGAEPK